MTSIFLAALTLVLSAGSVGHAQTPLLLTGGHVLDPTGERWLVGQDVLIVGERIVSVTAASGTTGPGGARTIDVSGLFVIPGLIDLHSHLLLHPYDEASWNDQVLREPIGLRTIRGVTAAEATVRAGFTTLRDLGTEGAGYADVAIRDAINMGLIEGPRVFAVTRAIVATGCYGPSGYDPRWQMPVGGQVADGPIGVRIAVREQIAAGADWIKVYADYRRKPGDPSSPTYSQAELNAIVDEARSAGVPVAAHASTDVAIRRAVNAGVRTIEHGYDVSDDVLRLMRERDVALCPTLAASEAMARYGGWKPGEPDHPRITKAKAMFARALRSGVTIACGSDVGVFSHGDNTRELELMVDYGMTPTRAIQSATIVAAQVLGEGKQLGQLVAGSYADVVVLSADPLADVSVIRNPVMVIKGGE